MPYKVNTGRIHLLVLPLQIVSAIYSANLAAREPPWQWKSARQDEADFVQEKVLYLLC